MNIPNDTGGDWRLNKFIEYATFVPPIEPQTYTEYCLINNLDIEQSLLLIFYNSICYSTITSIFILKHFDIKNDDVEIFWKNYKDNLIFTSARRNMKYFTRFIDIINIMKKILLNTTMKDWVLNICNSKDPYENYKNVSKEFEQFPQLGRFSIELFVEGLIYFNNNNILKINIDEEGIKPEESSNLTSALLNISYKDEEADDFDLNGKLSEDSKKIVENTLKRIQKQYKIKYPEKDNRISVITPKLCSFRNLFKGARYAGYHHDRQLEQILHYKNIYSDDITKQIITDLLKIRSKLFPHRILGELNGWNGIRKQLKKSFLKYGLSCAEEKEGLSKWL